MVDERETQKQQQKKQNKGARQKGGRGTKAIVKG